MQDRFMKNISGDPFTGRIRKVVENRPHFAISAIRYDKEHTYIEKVKALEVNKDGKFGETRILDRMMLLGLLLGGGDLRILDMDPSRNLKLGPSIRRIYEEEKMFLNTEPVSGSDADHIGGLPEF
jgi:hypothetical protein